MAQATKGVGEGEFVPKGAWGELLERSPWTVMLLGACGVGGSDVIHRQVGPGHFRKTAVRLLGVEGDATAGEAFDESVRWGYRDRATAILVGALRDGGVALGEILPAIAEVYMVAGADNPGAQATRTATLMLDGPKPPSFSDLEAFSTVAGTAVTRLALAPAEDVPPTA